MDKIRSAGVKRPYLDRAREVFEVEVRELQGLSARLGQTFCDAVGVILEAVAAGRKVLVLGVGKSGNIGRKIAATLTSTGTPAIVLHSVDALHGDLGIVSEGDVALMLSYSGETDELLNILPALKRFAIKIIAVTGNTRSTLAGSSDVVIDVSVEREACPFNLAPTSSSTAMLVLGDALAMTLLDGRGFNEKDFARYHPGGSIGRNLLIKAADIMRPLSQIVRVKKTAKVDDVIDEIVRVKAGAAIIMSDEEKLEGIFTQGDFLRAYREVGPDIGRQRVGKMMTADPLKIEHDRLAAEVVAMLAKHRVDDLVVVDGDDHPVGVIDVQDLSRKKLI